MRGKAAETGPVKEKKDLEKKVEEEPKKESRQGKRQKSRQGKRKIDSRGSNKRAGNADGDAKKLKEKEEKEKKDRELLERLKKRPKKAVYERAVYIIPYTSVKLATQIQNAFQKINLEGLGIKNGTETDLNTKALSEVEKANRDLDIITGFELIDYDKRMYVLEGLSRGAMAKIETLVPMEAPNSPNCTILKNKWVLFQERIYLDFNCQLKKIKLRDTLEEILPDPSIYLRAKVPENIYRCITTLSELRGCRSVS
jgi:hypothetical protein